MPKEAEGQARTPGLSPQEGESSPAGGDRGVCLLEGEKPATSYQC